MPPLVPRHGERIGTLGTTDSTQSQDNIAGEAGGSLPIVLPDVSILRMDRVSFTFAKTDDCRFMYLEHCWIPLKRPVWKGGER